MHQLIPNFLFDQLEQEANQGDLEAVVLFADTSGFTPLTARLSEQGREGTEVLATILRAVFEPLVAAVYAHGGWIAGFAGDAFKAIFPGLSTDSFRHALAAAEQIRTYMAAHPTHNTPYGTFDFSVRLSMAAGPVNWTVWAGSTTSNGQSHAYTFGGAAIDAAIAGEDHADGGELVMTIACYQRFVAMMPESGANEAWTGDALAGEALTGAAQGYLRIDAVTAALPAPLPLPADTAPALHAASRFYPETLLTTSTQGEFRPVYTLFINVARLPAPGAHDDFLPQFFQLLAQYGGYLCRIGRIGANDPGGTFLLFWGAPTSHENDLNRVLSFVLDLQQALAIPLRAGITHAVVYAGFVGSPLCEEYTCYGSSVNQAARQMAAAEWGQILLENVVAQRAQLSFALAFAGNYQLKGLRDALSLFLLHGRELAPADSFSTGEFQGALVGRQDELALLRRAVQPIFEGKCAGLIVIRGDAGVGKSRLLHEFVQQLAVDDQSPYLLLCQSDEIVRESLNPFRYALRRYFAQSPGVDEQQNRANFARSFDALMDATANRALQDELLRTRSFLEALVDLYGSDSLYDQLDPRLRFENTLIALRTLFFAESLRRPLLVQVEDAQWLDADSHTFLDELLRVETTYPLAVIATSRPHGEEEKATHFRAQIQQELVLSTLTQEAVKQLATNQLTVTQPGGVISPALSVFLHERAEGNPFFVEQTLLYLREHNLLEQSENGWHLTADPMAAAGVPSNVEALLIARIDRLAQDVRETVQTAAILGREFDVNLLSAMIQQATRLPGTIRVAEAAAIWSALSELRYLFRHALLRDAAYQMQLQAQRRQIHQLAAASIERLYAVNLGPFYGDLVHHFHRANEPSRERHYATLAGHQASSQFANREALVYFTRALELIGEADIESRYDLLIGRELIYSRLGERELQDEDIALLHQVVALLADQVLAAKVWLRDCEYAGSIGDYPRALAAVTEAALIGETLAESHEEIIVDATIQRGYIQLLQGEFDAAKSALQQALALAEARNLLPQQALSLQHLAQLHSRLGQYEEGKAVGLRSLACVQAIDEWAQMGFALNNIGICCLFLAQYEEAKDYFAQTLEMKRNTGDRRGEGATLQNIGIVAYYEGALDVAMHYFEEALRNRRATGDRASIGDMCGNLGVLYQTLGDYATALTYFTEAEELHRAMGYQHGLAMALRNYSLLYYHLHKYDEAYRYGAEALALARSLELQPDQAASLTNLGHIYIAQGKQSEAQKAFVDAVALRRVSKQEHLAIEAMAGLLTLPAAAAEQPAWLEEVWQFLNEKGTDGMLEPYRIYWDCYRALAAGHDPRAQPLLEEAYAAIQAQAAKFSNETLRHSFLTNVAANRGIVEAYARHAER